VNIDEALGLIREVPNFPQQGVLFQDITPLLADSEAFALVIEQMSTGLPNFDHVAGMEARGFIFASALAIHSSKGFIPIRKSGKLPNETFKEDYGLEYGQDSLEVHKDACSRDETVLIVDDVLATGGTACAAIRLIQKTGAKVSNIAFLLEITSLNGRAKILEIFPEIRVSSLKVI
jgi:adenine phosphoribosyltransferase